MLIYLCLATAALFHGIVLTVLLPSVMKVILDVLNDVVLGIWLVQPMPRKIAFLGAVASMWMVEDTLPWLKDFLAFPLFPLFWIDDFVVVMLTFRFGIIIGLTFVPASEQQLKSTAPAL